MNDSPNTPPEGKRFSREYQPTDQGGRTPTKFLREKLSKPISTVEAAADFRRVAKLSGGESIREAFVDRLIQIAFTDRVVVVGRGRGGEILERVSGKESIDAIKVLQQYDMGKAPAPLEVTSPDGSMSPSNPVLVYLPDNGRAAPAALEQKPEATEAQQTEDAGPMPEPTPPADGSAQGN